MKLSISAQLKAVVQQMLLVEAYPCSRGANCPANKIKALADTVGLLRYEREFLLAITTVQEDGRSCPASDMQAELRKYTNEDWRYDRWAITSGIRFNVVQLDDSDVARISGVRT